jgi:peptidoglycan biosynthesis protein MviN/MurJ (putative lipid II flippase)
MPNHSLIYVIVVLNAACQAMLIWRLKLDNYSKWKYCCLTFAVPLIIAMSMRLMVAMGALHVQLSEQAFLERTITSLASILLIAGPFMVTIAALVFRRKQKFNDALQHNKRNEELLNGKC